MKLLNLALHMTIRAKLLVLGFCFLDSKMPSEKVTGTVFYVCGNILCFMEGHQTQKLLH